MSGISVIIPTCNPGAHAESLRAALAMQTIRPAEVIVIDSSSTDGSIAGWSRTEYRVESIARAEFDHGGTRNRAARLARGEILVFMTQDAVPADGYWLASLTAPIRAGEVVATYARQIPKGDVNSRERFARAFNYPPTSRVTSQSDLPRLRCKTFFFSNVASAVRTDVFWKVGGFPEDVIMYEDAFLCAKLLRAGYRTRYTAEARVYHSHNYGLGQHFKRYFDLGVAVSQRRDLLEGASTSGEGLRLLIGQVRYVVRGGHYSDLVGVFAEAAVKLVAFTLGKQERRIPRAVKRRLSMHGLFWRDR